jgi:hypothetical protein
MELCHQAAALSGQPLITLFVYGALLHVWTSWWPRIEGSDRRADVVFAEHTGRHALSAPNYRTLMRRRWREWDFISQTTTFAVAA